MTAVYRTLAALCLAVAATPCQPACRGSRPSFPASAQAPAPAASVEGLWYGVLSAGVKEFRLALRVRVGDGGAVSAWMTSLDQRGGERPAAAVSYSDGALRLEFPNNRTAFEGQVRADGTELAGQWTQGGAKYPLVFKKVDRLPEARRPQEPRRPYPYLEEEVSFENPKDGVRIAGTLTVPRTPGPHPAVLLISGSGPQDRDETVMGHKPFLVLADRLTRDGVAVLRIDDRGVGGSTGSTATATLHDLAGDAEAAVGFLRGRPDIDPRRVGLVGHSEGGIVAPLVAGRSTGVAFAVLLAAPGVSGEEICLLQGETILRAAGLPEEYIAWNRGVQKRVMAVIRSEPDEARAREGAMAAFREELAKAGLGGHPRLAEMEAAFADQARKSTRPAIRALLAHDCRAALRTVACPVLALNGGRDVQVPPKENLAAIAEALQGGGNHDATVRERAGLNHLFQTCRTGAMSEYGRIEETFAPAALDVISRWITAHTRPRP